MNPDLIILYVLTFAVGVSISIGLYLTRDDVKDHDDHTET